MSIGKKCVACKDVKAQEQFAKNSAKPDGLQDICRPCRKAYNAEYYARTKARHNPGRALRRIENRKLLQAKVYEFLGAHPCVDCGETDIVVLDFDHLSDKEFSVSAMLRMGLSWSRVMLEIDKCEVVCANDHRRRTAKQFGWARLLTSVPERPIGPDS